MWDKARRLVNPVRFHTGHSTPCEKAEIFSTPSLCFFTPLNKCFKSGLSFWRTYLTGQAGHSNRVNLNNDAFTLVELLIAMAITGIVMGSIYGIFASSNRSYNTQDKVAEVQQSVRVGIDFMVRDIRMAGLDPLGSAIDPVDGQGAGIKQATGTNLRFTADLDMNGVIDNGDGVAPLNEERISYDFSNNTLRRQLYETTPNATGWETLIDNVSALSFTYLDANGNDLGDPVAAADLTDIRTVEIAMTVQQTDAQGQPFTRTLNARVSCRNLSL